MNCMISSFAQLPSLLFLYRCIHGHGRIGTRTMGLLALEV